MSALSPNRLPTLAGLAADLAAGRTTSVELVEAALARIEDPAGEGARTYTKTYAAAARAAAAASDRLRALGQVPSPLAGLPISIKDLFDVAGEVTLAGSVALDDRPPAAADAPIVRRLRAAGAVIIGKTNMVEFAYSGLGLNPHYGTPGNPFDRARVPGGSSSGAGVSVADGMAAAAIGTDTGGSVRIPAAFCGLAGFKPTQRRVTREGAIPLSTSLDSIGPLAASVACCALVDAILAGEAPTSLAQLPLAGLRLAVPQHVVLDGLAPVVATAFGRAVRRLADAGARIVEAPMAVLGRVLDIYQLGGVAAPEAYAWHRALIARAGHRYDPRVRSRLEAASGTSAADYIAAREFRAARIAEFDAETRPFDAVLAPTIAVPPPRQDEVAADADYMRLNGVVLRNTTIFNLLDRCALSLPIQAPGELPVGLMLVGETGQDRRLLAVGQAVEGALAA
ncbi:amidase [Aliidongia dinghuensis]|uniref:Amidase n=1 Tax=Aliidongia dinghuensis TaxID=1867774 RepID=A0A8J2YQQ7_9PROT|nr:amidase [Aliidongia dinghuensis]GGF01915.1 amidase [Aliidongia dinghuensis]